MMLVIDGKLTVPMPVTTTLDKLRQRIPDGVVGAMGLQSKVRFEKLMVDPAAGDPPFLNDEKGPITNTGRSIAANVSTRD